jgi:hypothetical protein
VSSTPSLPSRRTALVAVGLLLVSVPLWAPAADVTGHDYEYRSTDLVVAENRVQVPGSPVLVESPRGLDCFHEVVPSRRCAFEARLLDGDRLRADYPNLRHVRGEPSLEFRERYVAFAGDGRVYRRTTGWNDSAGAYVLGLERANASLAVGAVSTDADRADRPVRRAARTGSASADEPLERARIVDTATGYRLVYEAGGRTLLSEKPLLERLLELGAVLAGLVALQRGWTDE